MGGERDLTKLLAGMRPELQPGDYVFVGGDHPAAVATVREPEGMSAVVPRADADAAALTYDFIAAWITLTVHSALDAVGLTAEVSARLTEGGISCNVVAGVRHDHLFVPADRAHEALRALTAPAFDFAAYKAAFEGRDVERWIAFYADDAQWLEYRPGDPPRAPNVMRGRAEIQAFLEDVARSDLELTVHDEVLGRRRAAFAVTVAFPDGRRHLEHVIVDHRDGRIVRHVDVEAWD
jgi:ketosteroid isomerase-like protein